MQCPHVKNSRQLKSKGERKMLSGALLKEKVVVSRINEEKELHGKISEEAASEWIKYG